MRTKEKKLLIVSKFINSESARLSVENKGHSIFSFFKKKSKEESFIDELTSFFNKNSNADAEDSKFEEKLGKLLEKYDEKDLPLKSRLMDALNKVSNAQNKKENKALINNFDFESFKSQMGIVLDSLNKLKKVIPIFSGKSATKRAYAMLIKIYNIINDTIKLNKVNAKQSNNIYENLQEVQEIVSSTISSRLIKKSKHFEDKSKINSTLSNVYYEFSNLNQILFGQTFKELNDNVDNVTKGNQLDKSDITDKTRVSYYINLVDSGFSKLKKYRSSDFWSIMKPSTFEQFYDNSKDMWNNTKKKLDSDKTTNESLELVFVGLLSKCKSGFEFYGTLENVNLETRKDIEPYNEAVNILVDLTNDIIEIYELLFKSIQKKQTFTRIQHVNYSEANFENAKNLNYKKMTIISKFINAESARLALENKNRSMFSKKSSEESFIDELNNFYNKHANDNKTFDKYLGDILIAYEKDNECPNMVKKLKEQIKGIKQSDSKEIKDFDKIEFENQLKEIYDSLKNLKKVIPIFSSKSATKRAYTMLTKIYNNIKLNIEQNKDEKQKSDIIYDSLNEVKTLIPSVISSRLVKKSKHFGDESKINRVLSDVYDEFSNLSNILFDSTFEKLDSATIDSNVKFDESGGTDKTRVSYYINLVDSGFSKLKKYRSSDFWSIMKPSTFEQFYDNSKDMWNNTKQELDIDKIKDESLELVFIKLLSKCKSGFEFYGTLENVNLETRKDIEPYNEAVNILVDLTNDIIEICELLFESNLKEKTYTKIQHVNYSEIEGIHGEAYDEKNLKKIKMKDKNGKEVIKYFVKRSGDHIQGKVIYSGFLFDYADVDPKELDKQIRQNLKLSLDKKYKLVKDIFDKKLSAFNKTKAGEYGVRIIATAEGLGGKNMSSGIDDSYNVAEASVVEVSTKIISKNIKIRVYVACKALTINQMLFGKDTSKDDKDTSNLRRYIDWGFPTAKTVLTIKNHISPGKLSFEPCMSQTTNKILSNFSQKHGKQAQDYSKKFDYFKECVSKEQDSSLKKELEQLLKKFEISGDIAQFCVDGDYLVKSAKAKTYLHDGKSIFEEMFNLKMCLSDRAKDMLVMEQEDYKKQIEDYASKLSMLDELKNLAPEEIAQSKSECKEKIKECEQLRAEGNEMLEKLKDKNFTPTTGKSLWGNPYDLDGVIYATWFNKSKEEKRAEYKRLADDKIKNSEKMKKENSEKLEMLEKGKETIEANINKLEKRKNAIEKKLKDVATSMNPENAWKKLLGMRENKTSTPISKKSENNTLEVDNSSINPKSVLSGDYLLASVPILKSDVKLPKENEVVAQKESWMNPGKIWFTMSMQSNEGNSDIQKKLAEKECKNIKMKSTDALACVSDIGLNIYLNIPLVVSLDMKIQMRLYISLNKTISSIAKNLVDIKLKTPKGKIELN